MENPDDGEREYASHHTRGVSLARPKAVLGVVLLSLHGSAAGHARFDRSKNSTFSAPSELLAATRTGGSQATLASYQPCAVIKSLSVLHLQPRRACAARCSQRGPEGPSRKLRPGVRRAGEQIRRESRMNIATTTR